MNLELLQDPDGAWHTLLAPFQTPADMKLSDQILHGLAKLRSDSQSTAYGTKQSSISVSKASPR